MQLKDIDLNLLVIFQQLYKERQVSSAAASLELSQPAVSSALNRLRRCLNDDLFVRAGRGMVPTPFAEKLREKIADALHTIDGALNEQGAFDPATATHNFTLSMADIGEVYFLPRFMAALSRDAPHVSITSVRHAANLPEEMVNGRVDLAVGALPALKTNFFQRRLFPVRYVCLFRKGHPLDKAKITPAEFAAAEHVIVAAPGTGHARMNEIMLRAGVRRIVPLRVPHWVSVADILATTDLVATVPELFAKRGAAFFGLKYRPHPIRLPQVQIYLYWHMRYHREPANQWLRARIFDMFSE